MKTEIQIAFNDKTNIIARGGDGLYNLNALWRASGAADNKKPNQWTRSATAREFLDSLAAGTKQQKCSLLRKAHGGASPGVWAHWQVALTYAQWLSPEFHRAVNDAFVQHQQEAADPELKVSRALDAWKKQGKDPAWVEMRMMGLENRRALTAALGERGCVKRGAANAEYAITETGNLAVLGKTAKEFKESRGIPRYKPTRDHMAVHELAALSFYEALTKKQIDDADARGNVECEAAAVTVAHAVARAMMSLTNARLPVSPEAAALSAEQRAAADKPSAPAPAPVAPEGQRRHQPKIESLPSRPRRRGVIARLRSAFSR